MQAVLITIFAVAALAAFAWFLYRRQFSPVPLMLAAWFLAVAISQLHLSGLETVWSREYWLLLLGSLLSFTLGGWVFGRLWAKYPWWQKIKFFGRPQVAGRRLRVVIYLLFLVSLGALYLFWRRAGNFPLFAPDPDAFRFLADNQVPGAVNYLAQLARLFIPLAFFLIFYEGFSFRRHWDLAAISLAGAVSLILFTSRTQIFFIDLWVMALYLFMRRPNWRQALKFYPAFLIVSILVLALVPLYRQYRSYGADYLSSVTGVSIQSSNRLGAALLPIYIGVSFNQQALLHAQDYYHTHPLQHGRVSLDIFTNIAGKLIPSLNQFKSNFDLGAIFYSWWNTGTYLFPFVQDFGTAAFFIVPFILAGLLALIWQYWRANPNFLSINLYAYACFFIVMTVYLSFTVRAEMYLDLFFIFVIYWAVTTWPKSA